MDDSTQIFSFNWRTKKRKSNEDYLIYFHILIFLNLVFSNYALMHSFPTDPRVRISRLDYAFESDQTIVRYKLYQVQKEKQRLYDAIESKKSMLSKQRQFNQKISRMIQSKVQNIQKYQQNCQNQEQQIEFYQQYLSNLTKNVVQLKEKMNEHFQNFLLLSEKSQQVKLEGQQVSSLSLKDLMGPKCKFTPQVMNCSWQIDIVKNKEQQLQICKTNDISSYLLVYNYYPLPSKGIHHFVMYVQCQYLPKFLLGVSNRKSNTQHTHHIYFNSQLMQIWHNQTCVSTVPGQINNQSKLTIVINSEVFQFFIILDQVLLCNASLQSIKDQYLYLFVGVTCMDTLLKFDHSLS